MQEDSHRLVEFTAKEPLGHVVTQVLVVVSAKRFQADGQVLTQLWVLLSAKEVMGQPDTHDQLVLSANRKGLLGHFATHRFTLSSLYGLPANPEQDV